MRSDAFEPLKARAYAFLITAVSFPSRILMGWMDAVPVSICVMPVRHCMRF
jgi:hypothetical protein